MAVDIATLGIKVDASGAITGLNAVESGISKVTKAAAALGITLGAGAVFGKMVRESIDAQYAMAQLEARVKSTGGAAGYSAVQLAAMASEMQGLTQYSDEAIMSAQSLLLTFTKIRGDTLPAATLAVANLATAMGTDLKSAALQVGKALNDPEQGLTALRRSGVSFTDAQSDVIKALFATGQQVEAQKLILQELEVEFGGAAAAARDTLGGALEGLKNAFGDLFEVSRDASGGIVGFINAISGALPKLDAGIRATFGGFRLMWVDLQVGIQKFNAWFYDTIGNLLDGFAKLLALLPGTSRQVGDLTKAADALHLKAGILRDSFEAWRTEQEGLITGTAQHAVAARAQADALDAVAASATRARAALPAGPGTQGGFAGMPGTDLVGSLSGPWARLRERMRQGEADEAAKRVQIVVNAEIEAAQAREAIYGNFLRGMQERFAAAFEGIFTKGIRSFTDLFRGIGDLIKQAAAQLASSGLMQWLTGTYKGAGGGMAGLGAIASAIPGWGVVAAGFAAVGSAIAGMSRQNAEAEREFARAAVSWRRSFEELVTSLTQTAAQARQASLDNQFLGAANSAITGARGRIASLPSLGSMGDLGSFLKDYLPNTLARNSKEIQTLIAQLTALNAAYEKQKEALAALLKAEEDRASSDLRVRQLRAQGFTAEADALDLWNRQVAEFADAVKRGFSPEFLAALSRTQEIERNVLAAKQAEEAQRQYNEAIREGERLMREGAAAVAAAWEKAAERSRGLADASESLAVRMARAQGRMAEADKMAFELQQRQEVRAAEAEVRAIQREMRDQGIGRSFYSGLSAPGMPIVDQWWFDKFGANAAIGYQNAQAQLPAYQAMIAEQMAYIAQLKTVQAAEAAAWQAPGTLGAVNAASRGGSFNTIVSRTTAEQGDRMVDNLVTMRVLAQEFWPYLKVIADRLRGGVNAMLGADYQQSAALAGSALVT